MAEILVRMKFDRQEGNNYFFYAGFFNEGLNLPSFGSNPFPSQWNLLNIISSTPPILYEGSFVGGWEVPVNMKIRACKGAPWLSDLSIVEDLLTEVWSELLGFFFLRWFEVLYTPVSLGSPALPAPYKANHPSALPAEGVWFNLPRQPSDWPEDSTTYTGYPVAHSVSYAGATLCPDWAFLFTSISYWHILPLISSGPLPEEPLIDVRWREPHLPSTMPRQWGSYRTSTPEYDFAGFLDLYSGNPRGRLIWVDGLMSPTAEIITYYSEGVIIPYLSNTITGCQASVRVPLALPSGEREAFVFFDPPPQPISIIPPALVFLPLTFEFLNFMKSPTAFLYGKSFGLSSRQQYGFAGESTPLAGETHPLATTNHQFEEVA